ncbi:MAG: antitoxin, partial [Bauldia litoralis]
MPAPPRRGEAPRREEAGPRREEARRPQEEPRAQNARRPDPQPQPQPQVEEPKAQPARPRAAEQRARGRFAANDDRRQPGGPGAFPRRPSRMIYPTAMTLSVIWAVLVVGIALSSGTLFEGDFINSPQLMNFAIFLLAPIGFFWAIASMIWRSQEMKIVARQISDVAIRLSEPENIATDAVVSVSQAIRREVAAVGDGIERALARASELELLVHNEVSALERSYSDNETRMRSLIDDLAGQREAIVINSERVRTSIVSAQESLSKDLRLASESIAENVTHAGNRITVALTERGDHI